MIARHRRLIAAMHLIGVVAAPLLLGLLVGGPAFVWVLVAVALGLITFGAEARAFRTHGGKRDEEGEEYRAPLSSPLPPSEPLRRPELPELQGYLKEEWDARQYLDDVFASSKSAILWHLASHDKDIDKTGPVLAKLEYLVSVLAGDDTWRPPSPWETVPVPPPGRLALTCVDHARELIAGVLPGDDPRRPQLAATLGDLLGRWSASPLGGQVRDLYSREPASHPPEGPATEG